MCQNLLQTLYSVLGLCQQLTSCGEINTGTHLLIATTAECVLVHSEAHRNIPQEASYKPSVSSAHVNLPVSELMSKGPVMFSLTPVLTTRRAIHLPLWFMTHQPFYEAKPLSSACYTASYSIMGQNTRQWLGCGSKVILQLRVQWSSLALSWERGMPCNPEVYSSRTEVIKPKVCLHCGTSVKTSN